ncbi:CPBP family intramembrane metalloprotease [Ruminococcaceae bacterium OttesenSCG-928-A11]|nr:CPBP family intramembrane metalloprotease [Ruminococcaceae bacterium OttesenSCG-928-A11]
MYKSFIKRHPYLGAILVSLLCTSLTATGAAISQILQTSESISYITMTAAVVISAAIGLFLVRLSGMSFRQMGLTGGITMNARRVWFYLPLVIIELIPLVLRGFEMDFSPEKYLLLVIFTLAVGANEEIYFRGLVIHYLAEKGIKKAIVISSVIFGVLHIATAFGGQKLLPTLLQIIFAFLVGLVLSRIVSLTKRLLPLILWHALHNFITYTTMLPEEGINSIDLNLVIPLLQVVILLVYFIYLWKQ